AGRHSVISRVANAKAKPVAQRLCKPSAFSCRNGHQETPQTKALKTSSATGKKNAASGFPLAAKRRRKGGREPGAPKRPRNPLDVGSELAFHLLKGLRLDLADPLGRHAEFGCQL